MRQFFRAVLISSSMSGCATIMPTDPQVLAATQCMAQTLNQDASSAGQASVERHPQSVKFAILRYRVPDSSGALRNHRLEIRKMDWSEVDAYYDGFEYWESFDNLVPLAFLEGWRRDCRVTGITTF